MSSPKGPIYCRVNQNSWKLLRVIPQKSQLEIIFMEKIVPNPTKLALTLQVTVHYVQLVLYYKNHILYNWKYNPYPRISLTSTKLEDYIVITELLNLWKQTALRMGLPKVTEVTLVQMAKYLKMILKAPDVLLSKMWMATFNKITENQRNKELKGLSLDFVVLMAKLNAIFPDKIFLKYLNLLKKAKLKCLNGVPMEACFFKFLLSESAGEKTSQIEKKCIRKLRAPGTSTATDYDSDVEEIITPIELIDITDDLAEDPDTSIVHGETKNKVEILDTDRVKSAEQLEISDAVDEDDPEEDECEEGSDTVVVYQYVETDSDNDEISDTEYANSVEEQVACVEIDENNCEDDLDTEVVVYQYVKTNSENDEMLDSESVKDDSDEYSDTEAGYQYVETNSENEEMLDSRNANSVEQQDVSDAVDGDNGDEDTSTVYQYVKINSENEIDEQCTEDIDHEIFKNVRNDEMEMFDLDAVSIKNETLSEDANELQAVDSVLIKEEFLSEDEQEHQTKTQVTPNTRKMSNKRSRTENTAEKLVVNRRQTKKRKSEKESPAQVEETSHAVMKEDVRITDYTTANSYLQELKNFAMKKKDCNALVFIMQLSNLFENTK